MLWVPERRLLFIHNPKCAGTAVHNALLAEFPEGQAFWGRSYARKTDRIIDLAHLTIADARQVVPDVDEATVNSFGFVRNPYERFRSCFTYFKNWNTPFAELTAEELAFDLLDEERIRGDWKFIHFAPQYCFFYVDGRRAVDRIYYMEDLPQAWDRVQRDFRLTADLKRENESEGAPEIELSDRLIGRLNSLYARDFAYFGYDKKPARASSVRRPYPAFSKLWPEYRGLDISDRHRV